MATNRIVFDEQTFTGAGPYTLNLTAIKQQAEMPVPGHPDKVWGLESIIIERAHTIAALSTQAGATPGKRVQEILARLDVQFNGEDKPACYAGGRAIAELLRKRRGKPAFAAPADLADADGTLTPRYVDEFSMRDERFADPEEPIRHAAALRHVKLTFNTALVTGISLTSVAVVARATFLPIERGKVPMATSLYEEALGNGIAAQTRADLPASDGLVDMWLHFEGIVTGAGTRPQFLETTRVSVDLGGRRILDDQLIQSLIETFDMRYTTDAAGEESTSAPEVLHVVSAGTSEQKASGFLQAPQGGQIRSSATMSDSGNAATCIPIVVTYGVGRGLAPESASEAAYLAAIAPTHFPSAKAFATVPKTLNGKSAVPRRISHLVARLATPVPGGLRPRTSGPAR